MNDVPVWNIEGTELGRKFEEHLKQLEGKPKPDDDEEDDDDNDDDDENLQMMARLQ